MGTLKTLDELFSLEGGKKLTGDAVVGDVLVGKGFSNATGNNLTGTMDNQGQKILTPGTTNVPIVAGKHDGTGYVVGDANLLAANIKNLVSMWGVTGTFASDATAIVGDILTGKTAYVGANKITGTMVDNGTVNYTPGVTNVTITGGKHSGAGVVFGDSDLVASNIKSGINIFGVVGNVQTRQFASGSGTTGTGGGSFSVSGLAFQPTLFVVSVLGTDAVWHRAVFTANQNSDGLDTVGYTNGTGYANTTYVNVSGFSGTMTGAGSTVCNSRTFYWIAYA